ncbi:MAG: PPC domain-containing DNA-binding protein [Elusimicrobiota bacterium]
MRYTQAEYGRVFIIRLEDGDILHESIEKFAIEKNIKAAGVIMVGGADRDSSLVVGPEEGRSEHIKPVKYMLEDVHEIAGVGTIFPRENGQPVLHMHAACGRGDNSITGCVRSGVKIWHIGEVIIFEITGTDAYRKKDAATGFELLDPGKLK